MKINTNQNVIHQITVPTPFLVGDVNVFAVQGKQNILIDTGPDTPEAVEALTEGLKEIGLALEDIDILILTHHHPDHIGLAYMFESTAITAGHRKLQPWLEKDMEHYSRIHDFFQEFLTENGMDKRWIDKIQSQRDHYVKYSRPVQLNCILKEGDQCPGMPGWNVIETPGHAQSHIALMQQEDNVMIAGDHIIGHISSNAIIEAPYKEEKSRPKTLLQYRTSLKKCTEASKVFAGHGKSVDDPGALITKRLNEQDSKAEMFLRKLGNEKKSVFELCREVYPEIHRKQPDLTFSETLGHLDLMEAEGRTAAKKKNGVYLYEKI
ncbi:MBL fold metallo-hydrolase [Alkalicoccus saliphilus]|uniref:Metallo-beta-lactamase domain-containing protein n=1 Tax=Alkalicoccus saliphilus TaxID=200989 RepID=A0A2T4U7G0_9BACI|nr:MBL fold metallo-hydrolase [Alkalicoccus saliphilus]PTL39336.1 hypothetical protein C6Y45_06910 [Alkalicoccus saliphilus]